MKKKVLLISYVFPPYPGIGGRRWAKFAKYLSKKSDIELFVIAAKNPFSQESLWKKEVENLSHIYYLPAKFPSVLLSSPKNIFRKLEYKCWKTILSVVSSGAVYDRSIFWGEILFKKAQLLIEQHQIKNIIVTGAPFRAMYYTTKIKEHFPDVNLISDFRDPWTNGKSWGFESISQKRLEFEKDMEREVVNNSNHVLSPSDDILNYLKEECKVASDGKFMHLPHGFDSDDFELIQKESQLNRNADKSTIDIIYSGTLYENLSSHFDSLQKSLMILRDKKFALFSKICFHFYQLNSSRYEGAIFPELRSVFKFHSPLPPAEMMLRLKMSDYVLIMFPDSVKDFISTKFYEIIYLQVPIIYLGSDGKVSRFVEENNFGISARLNNFTERLVDLLEFHDSKKFFDKNFVIDKYSYLRLTEQLCEVLV